MFGKFVVIVHHNGFRYIFKYAQGTKADAQRAMSVLQGNFGSPAGIASDLHANYHRGPFRGRKVIEKEHAYDTHKMWLII